jgi:hypothetical protein
MIGVLGPFLFSALLPAQPASPPPGSYLCQACYCRDGVFRGPALPYCPEPGDIFLATDQERWAQVGHWFVGSHGVHHSGIMFRRSNGAMALLEAGPFNSVEIEAMDPIAHMHDHVCAGDWVWIRRRRCPLTPEQSARLTAFAEAQEGKPFATWRLMAQVTLLRSRGPIRTWFMGGPHGVRDSYFCAELAMESCVAAGLLDARHARPAATYPRDIFFDRSYNLWLELHFSLECGWYPPALWTECPTHAGPILPKESTARP